MLNYIPMHRRVMFVLHNSIKIANYQEEEFEFLVFFRGHDFLVPTVLILVI